jgi:hypothetical protein
MPREGVAARMSVRLGGWGMLDIVFSDCSGVCEVVEGEGLDIIASRWVETMSREWSAQISGTGGFKCRVEKVKVEMTCGVKRRAKSIARKRDEHPVGVVMKYSHTHVQTYSFVKIYCFSQQDGYNT